MSLFAVLVVAGAAVLDVRSRQVPNAYWLAPVLLAPLWWSWSWWILAQVLATAVLAFTLWRFGQFGGADAKGLVVLAWAWSPEGYPAVSPVLDAAILALLASSAWQRLRGPGTPFFVPLAASTGLLAWIPGAPWVQLIALAENLVR